MPRRRFPWSRATAGGRGGRLRTTGRPASANGASSLHLRWDLDGPLAGAWVCITVDGAPEDPDLRFWALQADFRDAAGRPAGGAHVGLQWHPDHPGRTAVNWGGYRHGGGELAGSGSPLASATGNPNTRDLRWEPGVAYRLTVRRLAEGEEPLDPAPPAAMTAWRATVAVSSGGPEAVIRDLHVPATTIGGVVVWSEVFAPCDAAAHSVLWSDPGAVTPLGERVAPRRALANYQSEREGGCSNTDSSPETAPVPGIRQLTATERRTPQGTMLAWPSGR